MDVLLTFVGKKDPWAGGIEDDRRTPGPVLSLAKIRKFEQTFLFSNFGTSREAEATREALTSTWGTNVEIKQFPLSDPTDYGAIILGLREHIPQINASIPDADYFVFASPGTPQMQASLMLLVMSGFLNAKFLQLPERRFGGPLRVLDFGSEGFPDVRVWFREEEIGKIDEDSLLSHARANGTIGSAPAFKEMLKTAAIFAEYDYPILLQGESGSGKEHVAQFIHDMSPRKGKWFIKFSCPVGPVTLVEDNLFGHVRGAYAGANTNRDGLFKSADGGTLFLDEIADMPIAIQPKLLRVLQDGKFTPLGTDKETTVNVRIVSGTHQNLKEQVSKAEFRKDLLYRLNLGLVEIPPLRQRMDDIEPLAEHFVTKFNEKHGKKVKISSSAIKRLQQYAWHENNVRELKQVMVRSCIMAASKGFIDSDDLEMPCPEGTQDLSTWLPDPDDGFSLNDFLANIRRHYYARALELAGGNKSKAARLLGFTPQGFSKYVKEHPDDFNPD